MTVYLQDADLTLHHGDALETLRTLPAGSVNCCITSPPYLGLRDYGTGTWDGGNPDCDHAKTNVREPHERRSSTLGGGTDTIRVQEEANVYRDVCGKCGARRVDHQLGLEATPDQFVAALVAVFREVRRVLADDGVMFLNLGDSHANKQLQGVPWRVAFALQADGWYLRSEIIWSKRNPMPESVTDRPTKSHETIFLLSKSPRYWFDQEAVREPAEWSFWGKQTTHKVSADPNVKPPTYTPNGRDELRDAGAGRNIRSVWSIATQSFEGAHFATFPEELVRRCLLAGTPELVCSACYTPVVNGRHEDLTEPETVQAPLRRVRDVLRGTEPEVLFSSVLTQAGGTSQASSDETVRGVPDDVQRTISQDTVLLPDVRYGVGEEEWSEPASVATGLPPSQLEGRQDSRRRLYEDLQPRDEEVRPRTPVSYGADDRAISDGEGVRTSQEWDQDGQPAGEPGVDGAESTQGHRNVPALRRGVLDSLSPCCGAPMRPGTVLDPFFGSGTTGLVARKHGRRTVGIELSRDYCGLAARRLQQLSLLAEGAA